MPIDASIMTYSRSRGMALFISLVLLLILTIIGVSAVQTTSLETRMARNEHDTLLAFQAAESALRDGEEFLESVVTTAIFTDDGSDGLWTIAELGQTERWRDPNVWEGNTSVVAPTEVGVVAEQPRYLVEHVASVLREENAYQLNDPYGGSATDRVEIFRITARGVGGSENARVYLQTTYGRILE
ncbi:MAG: pilus assembly PilX family protein [Pseudomonadota bacterium]